jgi:hypothetical protein
LPDFYYASRYHEDGDVSEGGPKGVVPFPGTKGVRYLKDWTYRYGNLAWWSTEDTVEINEWGGALEHNAYRRGVVAFGDVTNPAAVPTSGTATYEGIVYGSYYTGAYGADSPRIFKGTAVAIADFAKRTIALTISNALVVGTTEVVPVTLNASSVPIATAGSGEDNYFSIAGLATNDPLILMGDLSGVFFGPVAAVVSGTTTGPPEIGGVFRLSEASTSAAVVAGFIARKNK